MGEVFFGDTDTKFGSNLQCFCVQVWVSALKARCSKVAQKLSTKLSRKKSSSALKIIAPDTPKVDFRFRQSDAGFAK